MKRGLIYVFLLVFALSFVNAAQCKLNTTLLNQDPSPAVPGEYVKLVFQVSGLDNPECKDIYFKLLPEYPIILDPSSSSEIKIKGGTFTSDYSSYLQVPYKVRVDDNALDGNNEISVTYSNFDGNNQIFSQKEKFNLYVKNTLVTFDVFVKNYDYTTGIMTLQILNIGNSDIEAVTIEIPKQAGIAIKGSNKNVIGSLSSNEDTTTDFESYFNGESSFNVIFSYTDKNSIRRVVNSTVLFNPEYFQDRNSSKVKSTPTYYYLIGIIIIISVVYFIYKRIKKKKVK